MITRQDLLDYLGYDHSDDMVNRNVDRVIKTAYAYLDGAIGGGYNHYDSRTDELVLIIASDLYENRGVSEKVSGNVRRLVDDFLLQLRLEARNYV